MHEVAKHEDSYVLFSDFLTFLEDQKLCSGEVLRSQLQELILNMLMKAELNVSAHDSRCF